MTDHAVSMAGEVVSYLSIVMHLSRELPRIGPMHYATSTSITLACTVLCYLLLPFHCDAAWHSKYRLDQKLVHTIIHKKRALLINAVRNILDHWH